MPSSFWRRRTSTTRQPSSSTADEEQRRQHDSTADSRPSGGNASPENDDSAPRSSPRTSRIIQGFLKRTRTLKRGAANGPESAVLQKRPNLNLKVSERASPTDHHHHHHSVKPPPRSPPDPNKPLPPTPIICDDSDVEVNVSPRTGKPVLKLSKIMATLTEDDIEKLFSGAPHFYCRSESHFAGAPHPSVAFPFDEELEIRDLCDRVPINNKAWSGVSAWPHLTRDVRRDAEKREIEKQRKAHFHIKTRERPNMLSMQGLEKGTMGFEAALELPVGDSLNEEQFGFGSIGTKAKAIVEARESMLSEKGWLRRLPESDVLDRLMHNGDLYRNNDLKTRSSAETYKDLFHSLLRPTHVPPIDKQDHHSLVNQIDCLLKCLGMPNVWIDLSLVEWRIRLGQILWGRNDGDALDDATDISDASSVSERADERFWLLMQVLVATELLIRLDAVTEGQEFGLGNLRQIDVVRFERAATPAVKWSLLLARSWLENIQVVREKNEAATAPPVPPKAPHQHTSGWLSSLVSKVSLYYHHEHPRPIAPPYHYTIKGRHGDRQVDGLTHFARKLRWPGLDQYESRISSNAEHTMEKAQTPMPTSNTIDSTQTSYFGAWDITGNRNKKNERVQAQRRKMAAALHSSGWLSKSYIFGLLLPGEALSHFLMSTLLENDPEAMSRLGSFANLCGGFVYSGMSFWSTSCIVGRVLAAGDGASESMGWISTDIVPEGRRDGWLNICTKDVPADMAQLGRKSRIWAKKKIERESSILGDANEDSVFPADFIIPNEGSYPKQPPSLSTEFRSFKLHKSYESVLPTPLSELTPMPTPATEGSIAPELASHPASLTFTMSMNGQPSEEHTFPLTYDISFVTAYPCAPSSRVKFLKSPTSPTIQQIDVSGSDMLGNTSRSVHRAGHPLHKSFNYNIVHISELLQRRHYFLEDFLPAPLPTTRPSSRTNTNRVLVIDCTTNVLDVPPSPLFERSAPSSPVVERSGSFSSQSLESRRRNMGSDMEVLARALCSQNGWNALISRRRRGCLACAVREAGALGWAVVIRIP